MRLLGSALLHFACHLLAGFADSVIPNVKNKKNKRGSRFPFVHLLLTCTGCRAMISMTVLSMCSRTHRGRREAPPEFAKQPGLRHITWKRSVVFHQCFRGIVTLLCQKQPF